MASTKTYETPAEARNRMRQRRAQPGGRDYDRAVNLAKSRLAREFPELFFRYKNEALEAFRAEREGS